ncbi:CBM20 domain-containing protein [Clostridium felsineum]|uniref:Uncharacterized protein n=1 Tax=Clostridium felsineum TaxID=36839 RepID=A0A1S8L909_9CLOT|nr:CBM20 domain-containing protein [Clostridium felsineum]MCR3757740.1 cyclomaltodextrin glucanotransferase [Clostridium felsineum]URZ01013.1 hypothetical protein CLAUR_010010 [Clostridium felsineum]URZ06238.1 hypothetical protein CLROS_015710 [Clostridium felsineum]URZ11273.1 hypothetical protein CROST_019900 [Clostridium felsineum]
MSKTLSNKQINKDSSKTVASYITEVSKNSEIEAPKLESIKRGTTTSKKTTKPKTTKTKTATSDLKTKKVRAEKSDSLVDVTFVLNNTSTSIGENIFISGNIEDLGNWDVSKAVKLKTNEDIYPTWKIQLRLPENTEVEFKFLSLKEGEDEDSAVWENSDNRTLTVSENNKVYECEWS